MKPFRRIKRLKQRFPSLQEFPLSQKRSQIFHYYRHLMPAHESAFALIILIRAFDSLAGSEGPEKRSCLNRANLSTRNTIVIHKPVNPRVRVEPCVARKFELDARPRSSIEKYWKLLPGLRLEEIRSAEMNSAKKVGSILGYFSDNFEPDIESKFLNHFSAFHRFRSSIRLGKRCERNFDKHARW